MNGTVGMENGMDDTISRQAAKDYIDSQKGRLFIGCTIGEAMKIMLDEVPPAQPEWKWTPCSKEMPPKDGRYLVTEKDAFEEIRVGFRYWNVQRLRGGKIFFDGWSGDQMNEVLAWCELPEPWEEEKAEGAATP